MNPHFRSKPGIICSSSYGIFQNFIGLLNLQILRISIHTSILQIFVRVVLQSQFTVRNRNFSGCSSSGNTQYFIMSDTWSRSTCFGRTTSGAGTGASGVRTGAGAGAKGLRGRSIGCGGETARGRRCLTCLLRCVSRG